jgi:hypothetical protein
LQKKKKKQEKKRKLTRGGNAQLTQRLGRTLRDQNRMILVGGGTGDDGHSAKVAAELEHPHDGDLVLAGDGQRRADRRRERVPAGIRDVGEMLRTTDETQRKKRRKKMSQRHCELKALPKKKGQNSSYPLREFQDLDIHWITDQGTLHVADRVTACQRRNQERTPQRRRDRKIRNGGAQIPQLGGLAHGGNHGPDTQNVQPFVGERPGLVEHHQGNLPGDVDPLRADARDAELPKPPGRVGDAHGECGGERGRDDDGEEIKRTLDDRTLSESMWTIPVSFFSFSQIKKKEKEKKEGVAHIESDEDEKKTYRCALQHDHLHERDKEPESGCLPCPTHSKKKGEPDATIRL